MKMARVVGHVVSTIKERSHEGLKLMIVEPVDGSGRVCGKHQIAVDAACAGEGDYVLLLEDGGGARMVTGDSEAIIDAVIVGVLDKLPEEKEINLRTTIK